MWRNTGHPARLVMLDARACLPLLGAVIWWSWTTLYLALFGVAFFGTLSFFGLTVPAMIRLTRRLVAGPVRTAVPVHKRRRFA